MKALILRLWYWLMSLFSKPEPHTTCDYWYLAYTNHNLWKERYVKPALHHLENDDYKEPPPDWDGETRGLAEYEARGGGYVLDIHGNWVKQVTVMDVPEGFVSPRELKARLDAER